MMKIEGMTPYYQNESVTLYHGDCLEVIPALEEKFNLLLTDPPYVMLNINWDKDDFFSHIIPAAVETMSEKSVVCFFGRGDTAYRHNIKLAAAGYKFSEEIVWNKCRVGSPLNAVPRAHELIFVRTRLRCLNKIRVPIEDFPVFETKKITRKLLSLKSAIVGKNTDAMLRGLNDIKAAMNKENHSGSGLSVQKNLSSFSREAVVAKWFRDGARPLSIITDVPVHYNRLHPTQKPVFLLEVLIKLCSNNDDLILDPFAGSGTTGVAALRTGRRAVLIEQDEKYCEVAAKRLDDVFNERQQMKLTI